MADYNLSGLRFEVHKAHHVVDYATWYSLLKMEQRAYPPNYPDRSPQEISAFLGAPGEDLRQYRERRRCPNTLNRFTGNYYLRPRVAVAYVDNDTRYPEAVGYAWAMDNISGTRKPTRALKTALHIARIKPAWFTFRDIAVDPEYQGNGVASTLALLLLETARPGQPVSAFVHTEAADSIATLQRAGFSRPDLNPEHPETEWQTDPAFGPGADPGQLIRLSSNVGQLQARILTNPAALPAIAYAHATTTQRQVA